MCVVSINAQEGKLGSLIFIYLQSPENTNEMLFGKMTLLFLAVLSPWSCWLWTFNFSQLAERQLQKNNQVVKDGHNVVKMLFVELSASILLNRIQNENCLILSLAFRLGMLTWASSYTNKAESKSQHCNLFWHKFSHELFAHFFKKSSANSEYNWATEN